MLVGPVYKSLAIIKYIVYFIQRLIEIDLLRQKQHKNAKYEQVCRKTNMEFAHLQHHKTFAPLDIIRKGQSMPKANLKCIR